ncbi:MULTISPECIES: nuclease-related domain-containing protein [Bhargavaea]|uniref:Nuclease-related domain-containing protein n=1 Tax=Bhargavaea changchunensis TaxID=2134037 RepID=A0ABW2NB59_9BACL|nr:nuclease-related domain-containing protein [Bhargavaea sp. CC-171006]
MEEITTTSWIVYGHERLLEMLPDWNPKRNELKLQQKNRRAGLAGEERVLEVVRSSGLPNDSMVLSDIRLQIIPGVTIQIDTLVLTPAIALIFETKQIAGRLRFVRNPAQLEKVEDNKIIQSMDCPAAQFEDQRASLETWLLMRGFSIPVGGSVVFTTNPIIETIPQGLPVIKLRELRRFIAQSLQFDPVMSRREVEMLANTIRSSHSPYIPFPLFGKYGFDPEKFDWGPRCDCGYLLDKTSEMTWSCRPCELNMIDPYVKTLLTWFLLRSKTITVKQFCMIFQCSRRTGVRVLNRLPLMRDGKARSTYYEIDYHQLDLFES